MQTDIGSNVEGFFVFTNFGDFLFSLVNMLIIVGAILVFFYLLMGGLNWLTSGGDKVKVETAQKQITSAVIGLALLVLSLAIYRIILIFFGLDEVIVL
jgi:NADH:ubiquinone oxidoreductase subunit 6 (subunit J)